VASYNWADFVKRFATARYAIAALAVSAAVGLRLALDPLLGAQAPYITFIAAVLVAARLGGRAPALAATALSVLSAYYFFLEPRYSFVLAHPSDLVGLGLFALTGVAISLLEPPGGMFFGNIAGDGTARPDGDPIDPPLLRRIAMLAAGAVALGVFATLVWTGLRSSVDAEHWVEHTYQVLSTAGSLRSSMESAETSQRGYLLTGDEEHLQAYRAAVASAQQAQAALRRLTVDNLAQQARFDELDRLLGIRLDLLAKTAEMSRLQEATAASVRESMKSGTAVMDRLRASLDAVDGEERRLLHLRTMAAARADSRTRWILGLGSGSLVILLVIAGATIERHIHERRRVEKVLANQARLIDLSHDAIVTANGNRVITGWNAGAQRMYGWTEKEALGRTADELLQTASALSIPPVDGVLEGGGRWAGELVHTCRDGRRIVVESRQVLQLDGAGRPTGYLEIDRDITERKRAEENLRLSEEKFAKAFAINPAAILISRLKDGLFLDVNQTWEAMTGYSKQEAIGRTSMDLHIWPTPEARARSARELKEKGSYSGWEQTLQKKSGEPFDVLMSGTVMTIAGEAVVLWAWLDISERKRAEEGVRRVHEKLAGILESLDDGFVACDREWRYTYVNAAAERLLGRRREEMLGQDMRVLFPEAAPFLARYERAIAQQVSLTFEDYYAPLNMWVEVSVHPSPDGMSQFFRDVTERKRAEEALRESRTKLEAALASMTDAVFISDAEGRFTHLNHAFAAFHRFPSTDECAKTLAEYPAILEVFLPDGTLVPLNMWAVPRALRGETATNAEYTLRRKDTGESWVGSYSFGPIRNPEGLIVGSVVVGRDITGRKRVDEELRRLNTELEQRVRDRTAQVEASNRELEAFAYSVSHDLRAPLRGIDGWSLALVEDYGSQLEPGALKYLERVRSETQRMGNLVDDLLQLSRISRAQLHGDMVDLSQAAESIAARLREAHPKRQLEFTIQPGITAFGDSRLLEVALTNLLQNAVKFTGPRAHAHIEFDAVEREGQTVFTVRDNGVGFDMAYASNLFGPFQRLHGDSEFPGTGIGLATVQRVIHRHGGRVWAEAEPGQGAAFYFTLGPEK
jgi:PAS domain S-box-containing protein